MSVSVLITFRMLVYWMYLSFGMRFATSSPSMWGTKINDAYAEFVILSVEFFKIVSAASFLPSLFLYPGQQRDWSSQCRCVSTLLPKKRLFFAAPRDVDYCYCAIFSARSAQITNESVLVTSGLDQILLIYSSQFTEVIKLKEASS